MPAIETYTIVETRTCVVSRGFEGDATSRLAAATAFATLNGEWTTVEINARNESLVPKRAAEALS